MKLIPAVFFIIVIFLVALLFLQSRRLSRTPLFLQIAVLLIVSGILFVMLGKVALLIAAVTGAIFILSSNALKTRTRK